MTKTQIYLTESEKRDLSNIALQYGKKQSELIREAIDEFRIKLKDNKSHRHEVLKKAAGLWANRKDLPDFQEIRQSSNRSFE